MAGGHSCSKKRSLQNMIQADERRSLGHTSVGKRSNKLYLFLYTCLSLGIHKDSDAPLYLLLCCINFKQECLFKSMVCDT